MTAISVKMYVSDLYNLLLCHTSNYLTYMHIDTRTCHITMFTVQNQFAVIINHAVTLMWVYNL